MLSGKENRLSRDSATVNAANKRQKSDNSMINVGEEPVVSDSEPEEMTQYQRHLLDVCEEVAPRGRCKMVDMAVQCNISSNEMILKDFIKECANCNTEDVCEDFKLLVRSCKQLQSKYGNDIPPSLSTRRAVSNNNDKVTGIQLNQDEPNVMSSIKYPNLPMTSRKYLPTKVSDSGNFSSENFGTCNRTIEGIIETLDESSSSNNINGPTKPADSSNGNDAISSPAPTSTRKRLRKRPHPESSTALRAKQVKRGKRELVEDISVKSNVTTSWNSKRKLSRLSVEYVADISEDLKLVVLHCKKLQSKYGNNISPSLSTRRAVSIDNDKVTEIQLDQDEPNVMSSVKYPNLPITSRAYLPTKERDSGSFSSQNYGTCNHTIEGIIETLGETSSSNNIDDPIKQSTKPAKNAKGKGKATYKTVNTKKYETRVKSKGNPKMLNGKKDSSSSPTSIRSRLRKRPQPESTAVKRVKREKCKIVEDISVKPNVRRSWNSKRKSPQLSVEYIAAPPTNCKPRPSQEKYRRLYSPTEWLHSQEFTSLIQPDIK